MRETQNKKNICFNIEASKYSQSKQLYKEKERICREEITYNPSGEPLNKQMKTITYSIRYIFHVWFL